MIAQPGKYKVEGLEKEKVSAPVKKRKPFVRGKFDKLIGYGNAAKGMK